MLERKLKGTESLNLKKFDRRIDDLKITLILQKGRFLLMHFCKRVLSIGDSLPRNGKTIRISFLSTVDETG